MAIELTWCTAFLDLEAGVHDDAVRFWAAVTGYGVSAPRGPHHEFATLVPPAGDEVLRVQRVGEGPSRVHLDLHVPELGPAREEATRLGAEVVAEPPEGYVVLTSPAGLTFSLVRHPAATRPAPARWDSPGRATTHTSLVDQVCLDVRADQVEAEVEFWSTLTGWEPTTSRSHPWFHPLVRPAAQPLRLMVQAVDDGRSPATAHLDLACDDRAAEVARHVGLGASVREVTEAFTVLVDPAGSPYCVTDRDPLTGLL